MFDDLNAHFHENLVASYLRYREIREDTKAGLSRDVQAATVSATALYHLREHLPPAFAMSRAQVAALCPDYDLLGDISNVSKHAQLTRGAPKVSRSQDLQEVVVITEFSDSQGTFTDARKLVTVKLDDGTEREVFEIVTNVINFWGQELTRLGVLNGFNPFPLPDSPGTRLLLREEARRLDLEMMQGVRFSLRQRLQRYNQTKGCAELVDPTKHNLTFCIYKPNITLDLSLTHNESGEQHHFSIPLTEEQAKTFEALPTDDRKQEFIRQFIKENPGLFTTMPSKNVSSDSADSRHCE